MYPGVKELKVIHRFVKHKYLHYCRDRGTMYPDLTKTKNKTKIARSNRGICAY